MSGHLVRCQAVFNSMHSFQCRRALQAGWPETCAAMPYSMTGRNHAEREGGDVRLRGDRGGSTGGPMSCGGSRVRHTMGLSMDRIRGTGRGFRDFA